MIITKVFNCESLIFREEKVKIKNKTWKEKIKLIEEFFTNERTFSRRIE